MSEPTPSPDLSLVYVARPPALKGQHTRSPLLVLLHGVGSHERDLFQLAPQLDARFQLVSVRAPLVRGPDSFAWFNVEFTPEGPEIAPDQLDASRKRLLAFLSEAVEAFGCDPARVYLFGFSQGAIMGLTLALTSPRTLAGVVAIAGRIPPEVLPWMVLPDQTTGLPVLLEHGRADDVVPIDWAHKARTILLRQRVALTYCEHETGHRIIPEMLSDATAWLNERLGEEPWTKVPQVQ